MHTVSDALQLKEEPRPPADEVMQRPESPRPLPVRHDGPVTTHELPSRFGITVTETASTTAQQVLGADRGRKRATLISTDNAFRVHVQRTAQGPANTATWPANVPLIITHCAPVSISTASGTATVSIITEDWAD